MFVYFRLFGLFFAIKYRTLQYLRKGAEKHSDVSVESSEDARIF